MTTVVEMLREHRAVAANLRMGYPELTASAVGPGPEAEAARVELATLRKAGIIALQNARNVTQEQFDPRSNA